MQIVTSWRTYVYQYHRHIYPSLLSIVLCETLISLYSGVRGNKLTWNWISCYEGHCFLCGSSLTQINAAFIQNWRFPSSAMGFFALPSEIKRVVARLVRGLGRGRYNGKRYSQLWVSSACQECCTSRGNVPALPDHTPNVKYLNVTFF